MIALILSLMSSPVIGRAAEVVPPAPTKIEIALDLAATRTAGDVARVRLRVIDVNGALVTPYAGRVVIVASYRGFTAVYADVANGVGWVDVTLNVAGWFSLTAVDTRNVNLRGILNQVSVTAGPAKMFSLSQIDSLPQTCAGPTVEVRALDAYRNTAEGYGGKVAIAPQTAEAVAVSPFVFKKGVARATLQFKSVGRRVVVATDLVDASITGTTEVKVTAGPPKFIAFDDTSIVARAEQRFASAPTVRISDQCGLPTEGPVEIFVGANDQNAMLFAAAEAPAVVDGQAKIDVTGGVARLENFGVTRAVRGATLIAMIPGATATSPTFDVATRGTTYFVASNGSDANAGTTESASWATVNKVNAFKFKAGDEVHFRSGDTFTGCLTFTRASVPNSTAEAGLTITSTSAAPFTLNATCSGFNPDGSGTAAVRNAGVSGFTLKNAVLRGVKGGADGTTSGVFVYNPSATPTIAMNNIRIEDNDIGGFYTTNPKQYGGEIFFNTIYQTGPSIDRVLIRNNRLHGLIGAGSPDDNGLMGIARVPNVGHVTIDRNLIYDIGGKPGLPGVEGNGIVALGMDGATVRYNVARDLGGNANSCGGPGGIWTANSNAVTIERNEVYRVRPLATPTAAACDWVGYDLDYSVTNSSIQYNYSHDNWGPGILLFGLGSWGPNVVRYNVSIDDGISNVASRAAKTGNLQVGGAAGTVMPFAMYNNTFYKSQAIGVNPVLAFASAAVLPRGYVANNVFYSDARATETTTNLIGTWQSPNVGGVSFVNNSYYGGRFDAATMADRVMVFMKATSSLRNWVTGGIDRDTRALTTTPGPAAAPTRATTCFEQNTPQAAGDLGACLANVFPSLGPGSALRGAGINLTNAPYAFDLTSVATGYDGPVAAPATDFFGSPTPTSAGFNVGADGR